MVALTSAVDNPELLMEHVYPAEPQTVPIMKQTLTPGLEIKLERTHDLSAVIHVERLTDGRLLLTAIPLALRRIHDHAWQRHVYSRAADESESRSRLAAV